MSESRHRESPIKRVNPSGKTVWVARYTGPDGKRRSAGTYALKRDAQQAIDAAYESPVEAPVAGVTVRAYLPDWQRLYPRSYRTDYTNASRIRGLFDIPIDGVPFGDLEIKALEPRHMHELIDYMLREEGRARSGVLNILKSLSALLTDSINDGHRLYNPAHGIRIRPNDPRIQKAKRKINVWSWDEMHRLAEASSCEAMVRVMSDCGLRLGELLALERRHWTGDTLEVRQTTWQRVVTVGTKTTYGQDTPGRVVPVGEGLQRLLAVMPKRIDSPFLFPDPKGRVWTHQRWREVFWLPAVEKAGVAATPHELRHSWLSLCLAAGVDEADLAQMAGHSIQTLRSTYTHPLERSFDAVRRAVG